MGRRRAKVNQSSQIQVKESSSIQQAQVPGDEVQLNDVSVQQTPGEQVSSMVQGAVDEGATIADLVSQATAQGYASRLGQNIPVVFGNMADVTRAAFGSLTEAIEQACDIKEDPVLPSQPASYLEGVEENESEI
ncbi:hypothetical protein Lepto7375DRAFT_1791 [Leptolyngbya sp. PCC 7375]|nr:hypothetical protein Lepto7375DRAFT_1791 [Leptolyngbya sp. PCC 7375]